MFRKNKEFPGRKIPRTLNGSFTVEAAVLIPLTILLMAAIILAAFYIHDRAVLQGNVCECAAAGANALTQSLQTQKMAQTKTQIKVGRLLGSRKLRGQISPGGDLAEAAWKAEYPIPGMAGNLFADSRISISVSWSQERFSAARKIRIIRGISRILKHKPTHS